MAAISIFNDEALKEHFKDAVRRPRWWPWLGALDEAIKVDIKVGPVKLAKFREVFRKLSEGGRYAFAAWRWLRPNTPCPGTGEVPGLQVLAGLDHLNPQDFAKRLIERCKELIRQHPRLERWAQYRIAALDFLAYPPTRPPSELPDAAISLRNLLMRAHHLHYVVPDVAQRLAQMTVVTAMKGAANAAVQAFGCENSAVSANLMVPVSTSSPFAPTDVARVNAAHAEELWLGLSSDRRLLIVAETPGSNHRGFWVPLVRGDGGVWLPGAPTAFGQQEGHAVFKDDLPPLKGFGQAVESRWKAYMMNHFQEQLFVSLPFRAPDGLGYVTLGVLNVNVDAREIRPWFRAYQPEWLHVARDRVRPFVEIALWALLVMLAGMDDAPRLDTGSDHWDTLTSMVPRLTKGGSQ